jgi:hypothetical protein
LGDIRKPAFVESGLVQASDTPLNSTVAARVPRLM